MQGAANIKSSSSLKLAMVAFMVALGLHFTDHSIRGIDVVPARVVLAGTLQGIVAFVVLALVFAEHRSAAVAAAVLGFGSAILFTNGHLLPEWGVSGADSFPDAAPGARVTAFSWLTAGLEVGAGLVLGVVALRSKRSSAGHYGETPRFKEMAT